MVMLYGGQVLAFNIDLELTCIGDGVACMNGHVWYYVEEDRSYHRLMALSLSQSSFNGETTCNTGGIW